MKHIFIFAGSHQQAADYARKKGIDAKHWTLLYRPEQIRNIRKERFIKIGTWQEARYRFELENALMSSEMIETFDLEG